MTNPDPFIINVLEIVGVQEAYFNVIKAIYSKPRADINHNGEKLKNMNKTRMSTPSIPTQYIDLKA